MFELWSICDDSSIRGAEGQGRRAAKRFPSPSPPNGLSSTSLMGGVGRISGLANCE